MALKARGGPRGAWRPGLASCRSVPRHAEGTPCQAWGISSLWGGLVPNPSLICPLCYQEGDCGARPANYGILLLGAGGLARPWSKPHPWHAGLTPHSWRWWGTLDH